MSTDTGSDKNTKGGCLENAIHLLFILIGMIWLVTGDISFPNRDIHIEGGEARVIAGIWLLYWSLWSLKGRVRARKQL